MSVNAEQRLALLNRQIVEAAERRRRARAALGDVVESNRAQHRSHLSPADDARADRLLGERDRATEDLRRFGAERDELAAIVEDERQYSARAAQSFPVRHTGQAVPYDRAARIGAEQRTYGRHNDPHGRNFLLDVARNFLHSDPGAAERLARHTAEERVERAEWFSQQERAAGDSTTGNWAGLTVPVYLTDLYAAQISPLRPFADLCCVHTPLPPAGMAIDISRVTTGTSVGLQANELTPVSTQTIDDTLTTAPVQTAAGSQNVSRQAIERGTGVENATVQDLMRKYATTLDSTLINQATTGLSAVAQTVTYTSASPTGSEFYPYMYRASSLLESALLGVAYPSHVVMHSRRWNWLCSQVSSSWPIVNSPGVPPQSTAVQLTAEYGPQVRGVLANGLKVVVDNSVPTTTGGTQDEVYLVAANETMWLAETPDAPLLIRAEQPNAASLGILLVLYGYFAAWTRYQNCASKIVGTGTAAPAGF
jgi:hypothetical protein